MTKKNILIAAIISIFLAVALTVVLFHFETTNYSQSDGLPVLGHIAEFRLIDSSGKKFTKQNLEGKIWVADFFFTSCGGICPMMTANMQSVYKHYLGQDGLKFVSVSVDPETDSPQVLAEYAKKFNADPGQWFFLTGSKNAIQELAVESFKLGSVDQPIFHSGYFTLVDDQFRIRGYYDGTQRENLNKLLLDIDRLLKEKHG